MKIIYIACLLFIVSTGNTYSAIKSASEPDYAPFCIETDSGTASGFSVELLRKTLSIMGEDVSIPVGKWSKIKTDLEVGKIDVLPLVGRTPEREKNFDFTFPYVSMYGTIIVRKSNEDIKNINDLKKKNVLVLEGDNAHEFLERNNIAGNIILTQSFKEALKKLSAGEEDAVIIQRLLAQKIITSENLRNLKSVAYPIKEFRQDFCFAVKEGDKRLLAILNEGLAILKANGEFDRLYHKWFGEIEKHVLQDRLITIGGDSNCPPFEFVNRKGIPDGYNVELSKEISRLTGLNFKFELGEWGRIRNALKNGEIDMIHSMYYSQQRNDVFDFSKAHSTYEHSVFINKKSKKLNNLNDLMGRIAVVMDGDIMHDKFKQMKGFDSLIVMPTERDALKIVNELPQSFAVTTTLTGLYWIEMMNLKSIKRTDLVLHHSEPSYAVLPENKELLLVINTAIQALKESGKINELQEKWFGEYNSVHFDIILKIVILIITVLISILLIVFIWNRKLKSEIEKRIRKIQELSKFTDEDPNPILKIAKDGRVIFANEAAEPILKFWKTSINDFIPDKWVALFKDTYNEKKETWQEIDYNNKTYSMILKPVEQQQSINIYGLDITDKKKTEEHLRQVEKMQVIGELAGGIAHDFNNQLAIILGNAEILLDDFASNPDASRAITNIIKVSKRSGELTSQLLAYARKGNYLKSDIDIHHIINEIVNLLKHTINKKITIKEELLANVNHIEGDPPQIYSSIMNIAINARDAMPDGGELFIKTETATIDKELKLFNNEYIIPGNYIKIKISDTGTGIQKDVLEKIFEPFFTTKELGKGTGMGLSAVQGIITMHGGFIDVQTKPGKGTAFIIYLPTKKENNNGETIKDSVKMKNKKQFSGTVLLVDDEPLILELGEIMLRSLGFEVITAENGEVALSIFKKMKDIISFIIMDIIMPVKGGDEIFKDLKKIKPEIKIIIASGYSENEKDSSTIISMSDGYIRKPFSKDKLLKIVENISEKGISK